MTLSQDAEAFRNLPADLYADVANGRVLAAEAIEIHRSRQHEKAERIAEAHHAELMIQLDDAGIQITTDLDSMTRRALIRAALAALTEKENAR